MPHGKATFSPSESSLRRAGANLLGHQLMNVLSEADQKLSNGGSDSRLDNQLAVLLMGRLASEKQIAATLLEFRQNVQRIPAELIEVCLPRIVALLRVDHYACTSYVSCFVVPMRAASLIQQIMGVYPTLLPIMLECGVVSKLSPLLQQSRLHSEDVNAGNAAQMAAWTLSTLSITRDAVSTILEEIPGLMRCIRSLIDNQSVNNAHPLSPETAAALLLSMVKTEHPAVLSRVLKDNHLLDSVVFSLDPLYRVSSPNNVFQIYF